MNKKLLALLLAAAVCSCSNDETDSGTVKNETKPEQTPVVNITKSDNGYSAQTTPITTSAFKQIFETGGWIEAEIYDVYNDGTTGKEILDDLTGYSANIIAIKSQGLKEYLYYDFNPDVKMYNYARYTYDETSNLLTIQGSVREGFTNAQYTVIAASADEIRMVGKVFVENWAPEAVMGLYIYHSLTAEQIEWFDKDCDTPYNPEILR